MANRLIQSTSPYLLQHAHNPVDWFEWGAESLQKARREDKPILVSIGYSSCHWCHVMERESFEHPDVAQIMNENFVCIKVDREERPDVDQVYMDAVQAMGMNGGWPLNVFLTPDQKPFYGGTYFPPRNWAGLLINISKAYKERKEEIMQTAEDLNHHLNVSDLHRFATDKATLELKGADQMFNVLRARYDTVYGGQDKAPKFVMPSIWEFLLRYHYVGGNKQALQMVEHTLTMVACGGIFDQIGGGFARYSVDGQWFAPHFEKMLYDNAQLLSLYSSAYTLTHNALFRETLEKTIDWVAREMSHPEGGFYSALDADSEGVEGKFYGWEWNEFEATLGDDAPLVAAWFNIKQGGNWEHGQNILTRPDAAREFAVAHNIDVAELEQLVKNATSKLLEKRSGRIRPALDDKILTGWNAMMIVGLTDASLALQSPRPLAMAEKTIQFLERELIENEIAFRSFKGKHSATPAFLEDYAYLIAAYLKLYQATFNEGYLRKGKSWTEKVIQEFLDPDDGYFHFSSRSSEKLIARKKEIFDNVIPSANSVMARNLLALDNYFDQSAWKDIATNMIAKLSNLILTETTHMANWGVAYLEATRGFEEVAIAGQESLSVRNSFSKEFLPFALFAGTQSTSELPILKGREPQGESTLIYVCRNRTCRLPVKELTDALQEMTELNKT